MGCCGKTLCAGAARISPYREQINHKQLISIHNKEENTMHRHHYGFTMIDMMITIVIIAILTAISYPTYHNFVLKARAENARADILSNINMLERYYSQNKTFVGYNKLEQNRSKTFFTLTGIYNPSSYTLIATPKAANSGETKSVVYSSLKGMLLCTNQKDDNGNYTDCDIF